MAVLVVRNEDQAWALLERALAEDEGLPSLRFEGFGGPFIRLDPGTGQGDSRINRALMTLHQSARRQHALALHGTPDARLLTTRQRLIADFPYAIERGSTKIPTESDGLLNAIWKSLDVGKHPTWVIVLAVVTIALAYTAREPLTAWVKGNADLKVKMEEIKGQASLELAKVREVETTKRMEMFVRAGLKDRTGLALYAQSDIIGWRPAILELAPQGGTVLLNDVVLEEPVAKVIAKVARKEGKRQAQHLARKRELALPDWTTVVTPAATLAPPMRLGRGDA